MERTHLEDVAGSYRRSWPSLCCRLGIQTGGECIPLTIRLTTMNSTTHAQHNKPEPT